MDNANDLIVQVDLDGHFLFVSPSYCEMFGKHESELLGKRFMPLVHQEDKQNTAKAMESLNSPPYKCYVEQRSLTKDGWRWLAWSDRAIFDSHGQIQEVIGVGRDITEQKRADEHIKAALQEKEVLLREIHHRVKNNLASISSLLRLQSQHAANNRLVQEFDKARDRIRSMSVAHELLYQSENMVFIDVEGYMKKIVDHLISSVGELGSAISVETDIEEVSFNIDTAIPVGFILTELVSNCIKHAFPDKREGKINIFLKSLGDSSYELTVADDGVGMPHCIDFQSKQSFGIELVNIFTKQLNGDIEISSGRGTRITISFEEM